MPSFTLRKDQDGGEFSKKMDSIFGNLNALEMKHQEWEQTNSQENESYVKSDPILEETVNSSRSRQQLSLTNDFKTPFPTSTAFNRKRNHHQQVTPSSSKWNKPDYQKNPDKWTKYTLADVSDYELSDKSNTNAAMSFLAERKKIKLEEEAKNEKVQFNKPMFRKPKRNLSSACGSSMEDCETTEKTEDQDEVEKMDIASVSGPKKTVVVMPEYVIGQGPQKKLKKKDKLRKITIEDNDMDEDKIEDAEGNEELIIKPKKPIILCHLEDENEDSDS